MSIASIQRPMHGSQRRRPAFVMGKMRSHDGLQVSGRAVQLGTIVGKLPLANLVVQQIADTSSICVSTRRNESPLLSASSKRKYAHRHGVGVSASHHVKEGAADAASREFFLMTSVSSLR